MCVCGGGGGDVRERVDDRQMCAAATKCKQECTDNSSISVNVQHQNDVTDQQTWSLKRLSVVNIRQGYMKTYMRRSRSRSKVAKNKQNKKTIGS